jgi:hypothetical protein
MKLTKEILDAMEKAIIEAGTQKEFAKRCQLSGQHINKYIRGHYKSIEDDTWAKLEPVLRPYLQKSSSHPVQSQLHPCLNFPKMITQS